MKQCTKCKQLKGLDEFYKDSRANDKLTSVCKKCILTNQKTEEYKEQRKQYRQTDKYKTYMKLYKQEHREETNKYNREYNNSPKRQVYLDEYTSTDEFKTKKHEYRQLRRQSDIGFKLLNNLRTRLWQALHGYSKSDRTIELLGCDIDELKQHLESLFTEGMTWENYGRNGWHVDHILPCSAFELQYSEEQEVCFHYTNLQPLWAYDNLSKHDKITNGRIN